MTIPSQKKVIDRVEKLLRLAAPSSNTSEHERTSAALEAAKIFAENNLSVGVKEKRIRRTTAPSSSTWGVPFTREPFQEAAPPPGWRRSIAVRDGICADSDCYGAIRRGDPVWMRMSGFEAEYIHADDGPCGW